MNKSYYIQDETNNNMSNKKMLQSTWTSCYKPHRVTVIMRSAERVDRIFGVNWCKTEKFMNKVNATDLNMPIDAILHPMLYDFNPPITNIGKYTTQLNARALKNRGITANIIFCSPSLRCVQTAAAVAKTLGATSRICVEPGLLEPLEWYRNAGAQELPEFFAPHLLDAYGIDKEFRPIFSIEELADAFAIKNQDQCIQRISLTLRNICGTDRNTSAIVIAHAITMDIASRIGQHGDKIDPQSLDECTSYEEPIYGAQKCGLTSKLDIGVKYPPGSTIGLIRINDAPPYVLQTVTDLIPPFTSGCFSNKFDMDDDEKKKKDEAVKKRIDNKNLTVARQNRKRFASTAFGHALGAEEGPSSSSKPSFEFMLGRYMAMESYLDQPRNYQPSFEVDFKTIDLFQALHDPQSLAPVIDDFNNEVVQMKESTISAMWFRLVSQYFEWIASVTELNLLPEADRIRLIVSHLCKVICFSVSYTNYQINNCGDDKERFWFGRGFCWDSARSIDENMNQFAEMLLKVMNRCIIPIMQQVQIKKEEFVLLKVALLFDASGFMDLSKDGHKICRSHFNKYRTRLADFIRSQIPIEEPTLTPEEVDSVALKRLRILTDIPRNVEMMGEFDDESLAEMVRTGYGGMNTVLQNQIHTESRKGEQKSGLAGSSSSTKAENSSTKAENSSTKKPE